MPQLEARGHQVGARTRQELDICQEGALEMALTEPWDRVVNCAAYTNVDRAETEPGRADLVNRVGAGMVARACAGARVPLCHISTDFVFGDPPPVPSRPWREEDPPAPRGAYATSKHRGELACRAAGGELFLVRTSWLYGNRGPNFPLAILRAGRRGGPLRVVADQVGCPTWSVDLAEALGRLLGTRAFGTYHLSGAGDTTWWGFATAILEGAGIRLPVVPVSTEEWGAPAPRPRFSVLDNANWRRLGQPPLRGWREALAEYLRSDPEVAAILGAG